MTIKPGWSKVKRSVIDPDNAAKAINEISHLFPRG